VKVELTDLAASVALGERIAANLRAGDVIALSGELGAGKTTLAALGHDGEVPSPSFAIVEPYEAPPLRLPVVHADFYRLADASELAEIGLDDLREGAALVAEWPERVGGFADEPGCLSIALEMEGNGRTAIVRPGADWLGRGGWT
jgi:tRNA threonylcarbamoyladenosine biosynthesis protein TsaE